MKRIIVLFGDKNTGKTSTLNKLYYENLKNKNGFLVIDEHVYDWTKRVNSPADFWAVLKRANEIVGIISMGDEIKKLLNAIARIDKKYDCTTIVVACRNEQKMLNELRKQLKILKIISTEVEKINSINKKDYEIDNILYAEKLFKII